ncbi:hypothetical protein [Sphingomonas bacterium]|uniref:hypothetical protein n=1 Tax=Sphingomonas bacterium TaxID=1895847 RepID=UPI001575715B|nr:hypothetical protein [Sphingomonas bacterium]
MRHDAGEHCRRRWRNAFRVRTVGDLFASRHVPQTIVDRERDGGGADLAPIAFARTM